MTAKAPNPPPPLKPCPRCDAPWPVGSTQCSCGLTASEAVMMRFNLPTSPAPPKGKTAKLCTWCGIGYLGVPGLPELCPACSEATRPQPEKQRPVNTTAMLQEAQADELQARGVMWRAVAGLLRACAQFVISSIPNIPDAVPREGDNHESNREEVSGR